MRARRGHALFHAIVTMGAAAVEGGCGGVVVDTSRSGDAPGSPETGGRQSNAAGAAVSTSSGGSASSVSGGFGGGTSSSGGAVFGGITLPVSDASAGGAAAIGSAGGPVDAGAPSDCAHSEQFVCDVWDPIPRGCRCDPSAPVTNSDCPQLCGSFVCHSYNPQVGCTCVICIR